MIRPILLLVILTLFHIHQDVKVITYSTGAADTDSYESLSFWIKSDHRAYVRYARGREAEDVELSWAGPDSLNGRKGFIVRFPAPDTLSWVIAPRDYILNVADRRGKYRKEFHWENENNSAGDSLCSICAQDEKQAMSWLRKYFLQ
jgi:hypothetical protein